MTVSPADGQAEAVEVEGLVPAASEPGKGSAPASPENWPKRRRLLGLCGLGILLAFLLYYPVGAWRVHVIDDDPSFGAAGAAAGQSKAVAEAALLIRREIDQHAWTPNKPFFMPAAILRSMPSFQKGVIAMICRFAVEMNLQIGRPGKDGAVPSQADADLERAAGLLQYPPDVWMIDPKAPWARTLSSEKQYRNAARSFEAYNQRLAAGTATFDRRGEVLRVVLMHFAKDLEATAARLEGPIAAADGWFSGAAGELYYGGKGRAYAALLLLRGLGEDDADVLAAHGLTEAWQTMLAALAQAALPRPWVVLVGGAASILVPDHLAVQGYHLQRAELRLGELAEALR